MREKTIELVLDGLRRGLPEYQAAEQAGTSYPTWWVWRQQIPGLTERAADAKRSRIPILEDALYKAAVQKFKVSAILAILEKEDKGWRDRAKDLAPQNPVFVFQGGAAALVGMLKPEQRERLLEALVNAALLPPTVRQIEQNGQGQNGSGH